MIDLEWVESADEDPDRVLDYFEQFSPSYAKSLLTEVMTADRTLRSHPYFGRRLRGKRSALVREVLIRGYLLEYRLDRREPSLVTILRLTYSGLKR